MNEHLITLVKIEVPYYGAAWDSDIPWDFDKSWDDVSFVSGYSSYYFSNDRYVSISDGIVAQARIAQEIDFTKSASTVFWGGGRAAHGLGSIELINNDGGLDEFAFRNLRNAIVTVYLGYDGDNLSSMAKVSRAIIDRVESIGQHTLRLILADASSELNVPVITSSYSSGAMVGKLIPVTVGYCLSIPMLHTGAPSLNYSFHDFGIGIAGLTNRAAVYDSGVALTITTQWTSYDSGEEHGVTLLQATVGHITADATGPASTFNLFAARQLYYIIEYLLVIRKGWTNSRVDFTSISAMQGELGTTWLGRWVSGPSTYGELLTELLDSVAGWWYIDPDGVVTVDRLKMPSGVAAFDIDQSKVKGEISLEFDDAPGLSDAVLGMRNWSVQDSASLAGSVRDTAFGVSLTDQYRSRAQFAISNAYSSARSAAPQLRTNLAADTSQTVTREPSNGMPTLLMNAGHVAAEATRRAALYSSARWWYTVPVLLDAVDAAQLRLGSVVRLTYNRYGLESGRLLRVLGISGKLGHGLVTLKLWGEGPEVTE